jgi:REP element-mobilizing transposase RayT
MPRARKHRQRFAMPYNALIKGRFSENNAAYLVTTTTANRASLFKDFATGLIVVHELSAMELRDDCELLAWVLMPDHLHILLALRSTPLGTLMKLFKGRTARSINSTRNAQGAVWQRGFHDHAIRSEEDLVGVARYVVANPLRAKIVARIGDYPFWNAKWL